MYLVSVRYKKAKPLDYNHAVVICDRFTAGKACVVERDKALWSAVVLQAKEDLNEPIGSATYLSAVGFFVGRNSWARARREIAEHLECHADDIRRVGSAWIAARRAAAGLDPVEPTPQPKPAPPPPPPPPPAREPLTLDPFLVACFPRSFHRRADGTVHARTRPPAQNPFHPGNKKARA